MEPQFSESDNGSEIPITNPSHDIVPPLEVGFVSRRLKRQNMTSVYGEGSCHLESEYPTNKNAQEIGKVTVEQPFPIAGIKALNLRFALLDMPSP
jgi:hypothetical protein